jgi:putative transposase
MVFEKDHIFHVYNQGNNSQTIFFDDENYSFFLRKANTYILPYADILAWCLMPNHFHFMVLVNQVTVAVSKSGANGRPPYKMRTFNDSIGIMLRSYTYAINRRYNRSGKLFREKTKARCVSCIEGIAPPYVNTKAGTKIIISKKEKEYPDACFHYIHENPVAARLVKEATDWEFSSARDYAGMRNGKLVNKLLAQKVLSTVGVV